MIFLSKFFRFLNLRMVFYGLLIIISDWENAGASTWRSAGKHIDGDRGV